MSVRVSVRLYVYAYASVRMCVCICVWTRSTKDKSHQNNLIFFGCALTCTLNWQVSAKIALEECQDASERLPLPGAPSAIPPTPSPCSRAAPQCQAHGEDVPCASAGRECVHESLLLGRSESSSWIAVLARAIRLHPAVPVAAPLPQSRQHRDGEDNK